MEEQKNKPKVVAQTVTVASNQVVAAGSDGNNAGAENEDDNEAENVLDNSGSTIDAESPKVENTGEIEHE